MDVSGVKAVIFDMDGVLFLTSECHAKAYTETLKTVGITDFDYSTVAGMRTDEGMLKVFLDRGRPVSPELVARLAEEKSQRSRIALAEEAKVAEASVALIAHLRSRYQLALASSGSPRSVALFLAKCGYKDAFAVCLDGESVTNAKPAPDIYLLATERLGLLPEECVVIEDALSGVRAARAAGIPAMAVVGEQAAEPFLEAGANVVVSGLEDIEKLFKETR